MSRRTQKHVLNDEILEQFDDLISQDSFDESPKKQQMTEATSAKISDPYEPKEEQLITARPEELTVEDETKQIPSEPTMDLERNLQRIRQLRNYCGRNGLDCGKRQRKSLVRGIREIIEGKENEKQIFFRAVSIADHYLMRLATRGKKAPNLEVLAEACAQIAEQLTDNSFNSTNRYKGNFKGKYNDETT